MQKPNFKGYKVRIGRVRSKYLAVETIKRVRKASAEDYGWPGDQLVEIEFESEMYTILSKKDFLSMIDGKSVIYTDLEMGGRWRIEGIG
jgi:hypothetical protein